MSSSAKDGKGGFGAGNRPSESPDSGDDGEFRTVATAAPEFGDAPSPLGDRPKAQIDPPRLFPPPAPAYPRPMPKPGGPVASTPVRRSAVPLPSNASRAPAAAVPKVNESEDPDSGRQHTQLLDTTSSGQQKIVKQPPAAFKSTAQSLGADPPPPPSAFRETAPSAGVIRPNKPASSSSAVASKVTPPAQSTGSVKVVPRGSGAKDTLPRLYEDEAGLDDAATQLADLSGPVVAQPPQRNEAETLAVDRGDLLVRPQEIKIEEVGRRPEPAPLFGGAAAQAVATGRASNEDEETKAVPREELMRDPSLGKAPSPAAQEQDRTLALPSPVEAGGGRVPNFAAFAATVQTDKELPFADPYAQPPQEHSYAQAPQQHPHAQQPAALMQQQPFGAQMPHAPPPPHWGQQLPPTQLGAQPMASMQPQQPSPFGNQPFGNAPVERPQQRAPGKPAPMISTQMILLVAVGAVCLAIFGIGIYLFVTTKF